MPVHAWVPPPSRRTWNFHFWILLILAQGPDFQKILGKILSLAQVFPNFIESYNIKIFTEF